MMLYQDGLYNSPYILDLIPNVPSALNNSVEEYTTCPLNHAIIQ